MQGRSQFSISEFNQIKKLIEQKQKSSHNEKKKIRASLRKMGFYISDFDKSYQGFTLDLLNDCVESGMITIT